MKISVPNGGQCIQMVETKKGAYGITSYIYTSPDSSIIIEVTPGSVPLDAPLGSSSKRKKNSLTAKQSIASTLGVMLTSPSKNHSPQTKSIETLLCKNTKDKIEE